MTYRLLYFAALSDAAGCVEESIDSALTDAGALYAELAARHRFSFQAERLRVAVNGEFTTWDRALADGDEIAFIPPVSGG